MDPGLDELVADVAQLPDALAALAAGLRRQDPWAAIDPATIHRVLFLGTGSSRYPAEAVALQLRAAGMAAIAEPATVEVTWPPDPRMLVVAVSRSGSTAQTLSAAGRYTGRGRLVALTGDPSSPLAQLADLVVPLDDGPPGGGVPCRSYRRALVLLLALAARLTGDDPGGLLADGVDRAAVATGNLLDRRPDWLPGTVHALDGPDGIAVLAPVERRCSAEQAAVTLREGPGRPVTAGETGDWARTQLCRSGSTSHRVLLLPGSSGDAGALAGLVERGDTIVPVGADVEGAGHPVRYRDDSDPLVRLLVEVTVAELVAAAWWSGTDGTGLPFTPAAAPDGSADEQGPPVPAAGSATARPGP